MIWIVLIKVLPPIIELILSKLSNPQTILHKIFGNVIQNLLIASFGFFSCILIILSCSSIVDRVG